MLDASAVKVQQVTASGTNLVLTIQGYAGHTYQLQRGDSLTTGTWTNLGAAQSGANAPLTFTDQAATARTSRRRCTACTGIAA